MVLGSSSSSSISALGTCKNKMIPLPFQVGCDPTPQMSPPTAWVQTVSHSKRAAAAEHIHHGSVATLTEDHHHERL